MRIVRTLRAGWPVLPVLFLAGCASDLQVRAGDPRVGNCLEAYRMIDRAVMEAGVGDAEVSRIAGFPHLRTNRFLASFAGRDLSAALTRSARPPAFDSGEQWLGVSLGAYLASHLGEPAAPVYE